MPKHNGKVVPASPKHQQCTRKLLSRAEQTMILKELKRQTEVLYEEAVEFLSRGSHIVGQAHVAEEVIRDMAGDLPLANDFKDLAVAHNIKASIFDMQEFIIRPKDPRVTGCSGDADRDPLTKTLAPIMRSLQHEGFTSKVFLHVPHLNTVPQTGTDIVATLQIYSSKYKLAPGASSTSVSSKSCSVGCYTR
jgi:hypothetical protein